MNITFAPLADEKLAAATALVEVATVKPSGYLQMRGIVPTEHVAGLSDAVREYFKLEGRAEPVIYTRAVGTVEWAAEVDDSTVPDELPDDFA
jgi:hypothetical protein